MRVLFMGTPDFAVNTLNTLIESKHEVVGVVTQPDKPKGRGGKMQFSPVKEVAVEHNIPVYQPAKIREDAFVSTLKEMKLDAIIVVAFGQILSKEILDASTYGCFNVHASLLPKLRGAAPIQWSVIDGDQESGVTIMQMDEGIDTGDMLLVRKYTLDAKETGGSLFEHLADYGGEMILEVLTMAESGVLQPKKQNHDEHTYAKMLSKATGKIDFNKEAVVIERLIRGLNPWPSAFCFWNKKMLKIWEADVVTDKEAKEAGFACDDVPGTVVEVDKKEFFVKTGNGYLKMCSVQLEGKKRMNTNDFLLGNHVAIGQILTSER